MTKPPTQSIEQVARWGRQQLEVQVDNPALESELLLQHCTGLSRSQLRTWPERLLESAQWHCFQELIEQRRQGQPIAYLLGAREFWSLTLKTTPATLIPRPETELLVEQALARIPADARWTIVDLGTGTGAIALALAKERPACRVIAVDQSSAALEIAQENARLNNVTSVEFRQSDWYQNLHTVVADIIVTNPPYVAEDDPYLQQGDLRFEPRSALAAADNGLADLRHIIQQAPTHLAAQGWLLMEHGFQQGQALRELLTQAGFRQVETVKDLQGHERVTLGRRPE